MIKEQAEMEGLLFTGVYENSYNKEKVKKRASEFRKQGYRAVVVSEKANKYARGQNTGIVGYSVYIEQKYFEDERKKKLRFELEGIPGKKEHLLEKYKKELEELEKRDQQIKDELNK